MFNTQKEIFSIRKYKNGRSDSAKIGVVTALLGAFVLFGAPTAHAEEVETATPIVVETKPVVPTDVKEIPDDNQEVLEAEVSTPTQVIDVADGRVVKEDVASIVIDTEYTDDGKNNQIAQSEQTYEARNLTPDKKTSPVLVQYDPSFETDASKHSKVNYSVNDKAQKPSDKINPELYTQFSYLPAAEFDKAPKTTIEASYTYYVTTQNNKGEKAKLVGSDFNHNDETLLKKFNWSEEKVATYALSAARFDLNYMLLGVHNQHLTKDVYETFKLNRHMSDAQFAQIKAHKLRADNAFQVLSRKNLVTDDIRGYKSTIDMNYDRLEKVYNSFRDANYMPTIDYIPSGETKVTEKDKADIAQFIKNLPLAIRGQFNTIEFYGKDKEVEKDLVGTLGHAQGSKIITMNGNYAPRRDQNFVTTLAHEVGHSADYLSLVYDGVNYTQSISKTDEWKDIHKRSFTKARAYTKDSSVEGFADAYGAYLLHKWGGYSYDEAYTQKGMDGSILVPYLDNLFNKLYPMLNEKPKESVVETVLPFTETIIADNNLDVGKEVIRVKGVNGVLKTKTITRSSGATTTEERREPVTQVRVLGTKPTTVTSDVQFKEIATLDTNKAFGYRAVTTHGQNGRQTVTTHYTIRDGKVVVASRSVQTHKQVVNQQVTLGGRPEVQVEHVPFKERYVLDTKLDAGKSYVKEQGAAGSITKTTSYRIVNGKAVASTRTTRVASKTHVIALGGKPVVTKEPIPFKETVVLDRQLDYGKSTIRTKGVEGVQTTTKRYRIVDGKVVESISVSKTQPKTQVKALGGKSVSTTVTLPFTEKVVLDTNLSYGSSRITTKGVNGRTTTSKTYTLVDGVVKETVKVTHRDPITQVKALGGKTTVETKTIPYTETVALDTSLAYGQVKITAKGANGSATTTKTYSLVGDRVVESVSTVTKPAKNQVKILGGKTQVSNTPIPFTETVIYDTKLKNGVTYIQAKGQSGLLTTTKTYKLVNGKVVETVTTSRREPVKQIKVIGRRP